MPKKGPDTRLINKAFQTKPVIQGPDGHLHYITPVDVYANLIEEQQSAGYADDLKILEKISVEIPLGLREMPKPSIAMVLPEIPRKLAKDAVAFQVNIPNQTLSGEDFSVTATVTVYGGTLPDDVKNQDVIARGKHYHKPIPRAKKPKPAQAFNASVEAAKPFKEPVVAPKQATFTPPPPKPLTPVQG